MKKEQMKELREELLFWLRQEKTWHGVGDCIPARLLERGFYEIFSKYGCKEYRYLDTNIHFIVDYNNKLYIRIKNHITLKGYIIF